MLKRSGLLLVVSLLAAGPLRAGPFDAPFTGTADAQIVAMNLTGAPVGLGTWNVNFVSSTPGNVSVDGSRVVTTATLPLTYQVESTTPFGTLISPTVTRTFSLVGALDNLGGPYTAAAYPLDPTDAIPPSDPEGNLSGDANFRTLEGTVIVGNLAGGDVALNAEKLVLTELVSRAPIPGGEQFVYNASLSVSLYHPAVGAFNVSDLSGPLTINVTPEPGTMALLGLALPMVFRRSRRR